MSNMGLQKEDDQEYSLQIVENEQDQSPKMNLDLGSNQGAKKTTLESARKKANNIDDYVRKKRRIQPAPKPPLKLILSMTKEKYLKATLSNL